MEEVVFLFLYHELNAVTRRHFQRLRQWHPLEPVVPLVYQYRHREVLHGTVDVALDWDYGWPIHSIWHEADKVMLRWYHRRDRPHARRYVFFEYDILPNCSAPMFYGAAWNADVAAATVKTPQGAPSWPWWRQNRLLGTAWPFRTGVVPLAATLWSDDVLVRIAASRSLQNCYCELRMATLARQLGFQVEAVPGAAKTIRWRVEDICGSDKPTWYHPVKS